MTQEPWTQSDILALASVLIVQLAAMFAAGHAILYKRDPRSSIGWAGLVLLAPVVGVVLYWLLGVNRVRKKARKIYRPSPQAPNLTPTRDFLERIKCEQLPHNIERLFLLTDNVVKKNISFGNRLTLLMNGEETYPEMLKAIDAAKETIALSTYIFDNDKVGKHFASKLKEAGQRGVKVRILIDDIGARYTFPTIMKDLKGKNLKAEKFHKTFWPWRFHYAQLRNHRKLLLVDGAVGFIGGLNIRDNHMVTSAKPSERTQDMHFKIEGPILKDLHEVFCKDWKLTAKEKLERSLWTKENPHQGEALTRVIPNGPDEDFDKIRWTLLGAIASADSSISIITPYFVPDQALITALGVAASRGAQVEVVIPEENNHKLVHWACMGNVWQIMERGCKVYLGKPPFDHSKLFIIDGQWCLIGSSNWDARSFRLNFELNMEVYESKFVQDLQKVFNQKKDSSKKLTIADLNNRSFPVKFRDALARLFSPYL